MEMTKDQALKISAEIMDKLSKIATEEVTGNPYSFDDKAMCMCGALISLAFGFAHTMSAEGQLRFENALFGQIELYDLARKNGEPIDSKTVRH